jgi:hypothetical protein
LQKQELRLRQKVRRKAEWKGYTLIKTLLDILLDLGTISGELEACLYELDEETLRKWIKIAVRAENLEGFLNKIEWEQA